MRPSNCRRAHLSTERALIAQIWGYLTIQRGWFTNIYFLENSTRSSLLLSIALTWSDSEGKQPFCATLLRLTRMHITWPGAGETGNLSFSLPTRGSTTLWMRMVDGRHGAPWQPSHAAASLPFAVVWSRPVADSLNVSPVCGAEMQLCSSCVCTRNPTHAESEQNTRLKPLGRLQLRHIALFCTPSYLPI